MNGIMLVGGVGLLGSTVGSVMLAWILSRFSKPSKKIKDAGCYRPTLEILIPAYNEEALISKTLSSVREAIVGLKEDAESVSIAVGLDHCTDSTADQVTRFIYDEGQDVSVFTNPKAAGKWNTLRELVLQSRAEWVALVDVGSIWDQKLLAKVSPLMSEPEVMAIAPSYGIAKASLIERLNWRLERGLKSLESSAGGPISVHGATVFYKRGALLHALEKLEGREWLNDDVVIPLTLRTLYPNQKIVYLSGTKEGAAWVKDYGVHKNRSDLPRRTRMTMGNLEWIYFLYLNACKADATVGLIASRRVLRTFWAYAILFLMAGFVFHALKFSGGPFLFLSAMMLFLALALYRLRSAFWAGLQIPVQLYKVGFSTLEKQLWN